MRMYKLTRVKNLTITDERFDGRDYQPLNDETAKNEVQSEIVAFPISRTVKRDKNTKEMTSYAAIFERAS